MSVFSIHSLDHAPEESKPVLEAAKKNYGFIPNLIGGLSEAPSVAEAYMGLGAAMMKTSFTPTERHVVWFTVNSEHGCTYCMAAHTGIAHSEKVDSAVIEAARTGQPFADERLNVLRAFTKAMVINRGWMDDAAVAAFLDAGFTKRHVLEIVLGIAHKVLSNYANHLLETPVDAPFTQFAWEKPAAEAAE